jgi:hypothetical protein
MKPTTCIYSVRNSKDSQGVNEMQAKYWTLREGLKFQRKRTSASEPRVCNEKPKK